MVRLVPCPGGAQLSSGWLPREGEDCGPQGLDRVPRAAGEQEAPCRGAQCHLGKCAAALCGRSPCVLERSWEGLSRAPGIVGPAWVEAAVLCVTHAVPAMSGPQAFFTLLLSQDDQCQTDGVVGAFPESILCFQLSPLGRKAQQSWLMVGAERSINSLHGHRNLQSLRAVPVCLLPFACFLSPTFSFSFSPLWCQDGTQGPACGRQALTTELHSSPSHLS